MLRRQNHERHAEHSVDPRSERSERLLFESVFRNIELYLDAFASANPISLHCVDSLRPIDLGLVEKLFSVISDFEEPLVHVPLLNGCIAPFTHTVDYLFISEHRFA